MCGSGERKGVLPRGASSAALKSEQAPALRVFDHADEREKSTDHLQKLPDGEATFPFRESSFLKVEGRIPERESKIPDQELCVAFQEFLILPAEVKFADGAAPLLDRASFPNRLAGASELSV
jgi:hypothetical protein